MKKKQEGGRTMDFQAQRELMCELGRRMWMRGWVASNDGNLSLRLPGERFLITSTGVSKGFLRPEMLLVIGPDGTVLEGAEGYRPTSETGLHLMCYRLRPEIGGVCHAHPPTATAFACARRGLERPILGEIIMTLGTVPVAPYARTGTEELPRAVEPLLREHDGVLLANHGALTVGESLEQAYYRMETVEHTAQIHWRVQALGGGVSLSDEQVEALRP